MRCLCFVIYSLGDKLRVVKWVLPQKYLCLWWAPHFDSRQPEEGFGSLSKIARAARGQEGAADVEAQELGKIHAMGKSKYAWWQP